MRKRSLSRPGAADAARAANAATLDEPAAPLLPGAARGETLQRLQVGLFGLMLMILLVGLASVIGSQANLAEANAVPDAAPTTEPRAGEGAPANPLENAGVVPDIAPDNGLSPMVDPLAAPPKSERPAEPGERAPR